jgi:uncharacterized membrane protein
MTVQPLPHTSDENLLAAISHFFGFLVALLVWAFQKDKSRYVRFQALQAMAFDVLVSVITVLLAGCFILLIAAILGISIGDIAIFSSQNNPTAEPVRMLVALLGGIPFLGFCLLFLIVAVISIARLVATIQTFLGNDFHYPWLGDFVARNLEPGAPKPD